MSRPSDRETEWDGCSGPPRGGGGQAGPDPRDLTVFRGRGHALHSKTRAGGKGKGRRPTVTAARGLGGCRCADVRQSHLQHGGCSWRDRGDSSWWCEARSGRKTGQRSRVCSRHRVSGGLGRNEAEQGGGRGRRTPAFRCNHRGRAPPRLCLTWAPLTWAPLTWAQRNQAKPHASGEGVGNTADQPDLTHACRTRRPTQQNSRSLKGAGTLSVTGHTDAGKQVSRGFRGMKPREARPLNAASSGKNQQ